MADTATGPPPVLVRVLGPCAVQVDGRDVSVSAVQRRVLARLAMTPGEVVTVDVVADAVWAEPPRTATASLRNQVSRLRGRTTAALIATGPQGYQLAAPTDLELLDRLVRAAPDMVAADAHGAFVALDEALRGWRGRPFADLDHGRDVEVHRQRAAEIRRAAEDARLLAGLAAGEYGWAVPEAERLVAESPLDERRWVVLAEALEHAGRRGEALATVDRARRTLRDRSGLTPGDGLRDVERRVLATSGARGRSDRTAGGDTHPLGRDRELDRLVSVIRSGGVAMVTGEPGVGRSTVLAALARRARAEGVVVADATCALHPATPVSGLRDLLESVGAQLDTSLGPVDGFVRSVAGALGERRGVLLVDDVHHAGPTTRAALASAASRHERLAVVVSAPAPVRLDHTGTDRTEEIALGPLGHDAVRQLVAASGVGEDRLDAVTDRIVELSGGTPLFVDFLLSDAGAGIDPSPESWRAPSRLADVVRERIAPVAAPGGEVLELAAVHGAAIDVATVERLAGPEAVDAALRSGLFETVAPPASESTGALRFRHGVVREVVMASLAPARRVELHHALGTDARDHGAGPVTVAHHLVPAAELDGPAAYDAAVRAAYAAARLGAHTEAADWFGTAAEVAEMVEGPHGRARVRALIGRGDELRLAGDPSHPGVLFDAADRARRHGDPDLVADAAFALLQLGSTSETGRLHERAVALADHVLATSGDPDRRAVVAAASSLAHSMSGHPDRCRSLFAEAERTARSSETRRRVLPFAFLGLGAPGELDRRDHIATELLDLATDADDPVAEFEAHHLSFSVGLQRADGARVRGALVRMGELVDRVGDVGRRWSLLYSRAAVAHLEGDLARSEALAEDAMRLFAPVSASRALAVHGGQLIPLRWAEGRMAELAELFDQLVADQPGVPAWHAALALALVSVDPERAEAHAARALDDVPYDFTWLAAHVVGGRAAAVVGSESTARAYVERLLPWRHLVCWQGTCSYGPVATVLAMLHEHLGEHVAAAGFRAEAAALARRLGAPVFVREVAPPSP